MNLLMMTLLYLALFFCIGLVGYRGFRFLNRKIRETETGWQLLAFSLLLFGMCAALLVGGLYAFVEIYRLVAN